MIHPWAMMEVYLLGVIVAYVKLTDLARLELGIAVYAFVGADRRDGRGRRLARPARGLAASRRPRRPTPLPPAAGRRAVELPRLRPARARPARRRRMRRSPARAAAPRCTSASPDSLARTWALVIAAVILYIPANLLPVMTVISFGQGEPDTILSGVKALIAAGMWPVALLVFFASITVPVLKLVGLTFLIVSVQRRSAWRPRDRTLLYRIIEAIGRWSMVDIFMISILVALVEPRHDRHDRARRRRDRVRRRGDHHDDRVRWRSIPG